VSQAGVDSRNGVVGYQVVPHDLNGSARPVGGTEQERGDLLPSRTENPAHPDDLSGAELERHVAHFPARDLCHAQYGALRLKFTVDVDVGYGSSRDQLNHLIVVE